MPSIREVAKEAGVSIATVSRALNGHQSVNPELRARVLEAAGACNYQPTVGKRTAERIALIYTGPFLVGSPYDSSCLDGIVTAMRRSKYDLVTLDMSRDRNRGESLRQFFTRKGVAGAIVRSTFDDRELLQELAAESLPMVVLGDHFEANDLHFCYADSRIASREAIEHLLSLGHQQIGFASCDRDDGDHNDRMSAFRSVMESVGLLREEFIYRVPPYRMDGAPLIRRILSRDDHPTALFIADPLVAVGVVNEAHSLGVSVPGDLSVVAVDDSDTRNMVHPQLSAVCQDSKRIGEAAFEAVCDLVSGEAPQLDMGDHHQAWFEIHDSTAPPPKVVSRFRPGARQGVRS